jgi:hypothetical protein
VKSAQDVSDSGNAKPQVPEAGLLDAQHAFAIGPQTRPIRQNAGQH